VSTPLDRRDFLARFAALPIVSALAGGRSKKQARPPMTVYKEPTCGCCSKWVDHVKEAGYKVTVRDVKDMAPIKKDLGVPAALASCHTAVVGAYLVEGHVPADLIDKMLAEKATGRGLAVPGMPSGSPGMEVGGVPDRYDVLLFGTDGKTRVFAKRGGPTASETKAGGSLARDRKSRTYLRALHSDAAALPQDRIRVNDD
jgi:hypothetical protein